MTDSYWKSVGLPVFETLGDSTEADAVVIGGGMTGICAAYLLNQSGRRVVLLERDRCAELDTNNTTAHLTCVTDLRLQQLCKRLGNNHASAVWDAGLAAILQIEELVRREKIDCDYERTPGFLCAPLERDTSDNGNLEELKREAQLGAELGFGASFESSVRLLGRAGVRFPNQAQMHPRKFLRGLLLALQRDGARVFEHSEVREIERQNEGQDGRIRVHATGGRSVTCRFVVIATDVPLTGLSNVASAALLQTKLAAYTSYAIGGEIPRSVTSPACYWDTGDPYFYLRVSRQEQSNYVIFGGLDHRTGQADDAEQRYAKLEEVIQRFLPAFHTQQRWSGQIIESNDGLPLIGQTTAGQFVATGYSGNGLTFGMLAAMMARDACCGRVNPWTKLFDANRTSLVSGAWDYVRENLYYPYYMLKDRLTGSERVPLDRLAPGEGRILNVDGERTAAYRSPTGALTLLSPVCTHLGCIVHWNAGDSTWDCPCHGSRFRATGEVLAGPAETPLQERRPKVDET